MHERRLSRSSRSRDPSGHLHEAEVEAATRPPQRYRHHAIVGTWRRRYSKGHNVREGRATWRPSRGPKRCRSASVCRLFGACPSIEPVRQCLRSTAIGYQRFRSVLSYRTYAGCAWVTLAKMTFRTKPNEVEFQKLTLRNITVSDKAMRTRSYEAADLKRLLSPHAAGRSIPSAIRYRDGSSIRSISGVGRFVEASPRSSLEDITKWVVSRIDSISTSQFVDNYLNIFAKKIALPDVLSSCIPIAILIEVNSLLDKIESDDCVVKYTPRYGGPIKVSERVCQRLIYGLEKVHEVVGSQYKVNGECDNTYLRINSNTITLRSNLLSRFKVTNNDDEYTLQRFIVKYGFYSVAFSDPKYMYFMGKCFEDTSGVSDIQGILDILIPKTELLKVNSEKGDFSSSSTSFSSKSMFKAVEEIHSNDDFIFCDDLGIECADHITINQNEACINFIHSKHGDISTSASKLHDVVGQGIKNLGYVYSSEEAICERANTKFAGNYNINKQSTNISRVRKGVLSSLDSSIETLFKNYALHRKCILSCSFISKSLIEAEFKKIASGTKVKGHVIQLLWILSSFVHASKEANVIPVVYCLP